MCIFFFFFFQAEDGIRDYKVTGVQTCALPIYRGGRRGQGLLRRRVDLRPRRWHGRVAAHLDQARRHPVGARRRSEEHTSELQSPCNLVCRLLLEKKKKQTVSAPLAPAVSAAYE